MLVYCSLCVCNLFIRAGNRGRWPASVKLVTLPYIAGGAIQNFAVILIDWVRSRKSRFFFGCLLVGLSVITIT